jgi:hypothetical protein
MGGGTVTVLGLSRRPKRWITVDLRARVFENWRVKLVYEPAVLRRLADVKPLTAAEAARVASVLHRVASTDRVRLIARTEPDASEIRQELQSQGVVVLRAALPTPPATQAADVYVLYDGADPIAGAAIYEIGNHRSWGEAWTVRDRPDALAELIVAVQRREPATTLWWLSELVADIRIARDDHE